MSEHAWKQARAVLRGRDGGNTILLLDFIHLLDRSNRWTDQRLLHLLIDLNQRFIERNVSCLLIRNCGAKGGHTRPSVLERSDHFHAIATSRLLLARDPTQPDYFLLSHAINRHGALTQTSSLHIQPMFDHPELPLLTTHGYHCLKALDLIENRPDVLCRRHLAQQLLGFITDSKDPIHVSTLYALIPHCSTFQIHRSLSDLLRTEQIERPTRGFYAKPPENPTFVPPKTTPARTHKSPLTNTLNDTAAITQEAQPTNQLNSTATTPPPNLLNGTPPTNFNSPAATTHESLPANMLNGTPSTNFNSPAATTHESQPPNLLNGTTPITHNSPPATLLPPSPSREADKSPENSIVLPREVAIA